ncbi:chemotaxis protein CheW [Wansuia hejianensis]|uniref:Purine-binding chemotaxis protein CheW n=1 Tax=Wansuia hejianensis TaxID=2763667 RepID=A0A926IN53_9FIRM|nr:chemotaxis protein CheW [Wansuia hejianensis]MBC8590338.1 purine-binding chemotaxis protein CheW [Wansuia hejianensis]
MKQYVVFESNNQNFALNLSVVERIIELENPKKIPESSSYLLGVTQYRGMILPIIDLTKRLYDVYSNHNIDSKVIVVLWKDTQIGLLVDNVIGIKTFSEEQFENYNADIQILKEYVSGFIKAEEDITFILDTDKLFDLEQEKELLSTTEKSETPDTDPSKNIGSHEGEIEP